MRDIPLDFRCQCKRHPEVCLGKMTQEDLLCDICRTQTCGVFFTAPLGAVINELPLGETPGSPWKVHGHVLVDNFDWTLTDNARHPA